MELDIPKDALLYADGAYNSFDLEDVLQDEGIKLLAKRGVSGKKRLRSRQAEREIRRGLGSNQGLCRDKAP